eukprot:COSAG04_NODE_337_length_16405_cov_652.804060_11_plen_632_part_00
MDRPAVAGAGEDAVAEAVVGLAGMHPSAGSQGAPAIKQELLLPCVNIAAVRNHPTGAEAAGAARAEEQGGADQQGNVSEQAQREGGGAARKRRRPTDDEDDAGQEATPATWTVRGRRPAELWSGRPVEPALIRRLARKAGVTESAQSMIRRARREKDDEECEEEGSVAREPAPSAGDEDEGDGLSAYERERLENISRNEEQLRALDLGSQPIGAAAAAASPSSARTPRQRTKRRRQQQGPARSSFRLRGAAAPDYTGVRVIGREGGAATIGEAEMEAEEQGAEKVEQEEEEKDGEYAASDHEEQEQGSDGDDGDDPSAMFSVGAMIEAQDTAKTGWYPARVLGLTEDGVKIHYMGWKARFDEVIQLGSGRLRREGEGGGGDENNKESEEESEKESEEVSEEEEEEPRPRKRQRTAAPKPKRQRVSEYVGVSKSGRKWAARIHHEGKQHLGLFGDEEAAARAFDAAARRLRGDQAHGGRASKHGFAWRLNFPTAEEEAAAVDPAKVVAEAAAKVSEALVAQRRAAGQPSSPFPGVSWNKVSRKWEAKIMRGGKTQFLGSFAKEEDAAAAVKAAGAVERKPSSAHRGVSWNKDTGKWMARIGIGGGKEKYLGRFEDEEEAAEAYRRAAAERDA